MKMHRKQESKEADRQQTRPKFCNNTSNPYWARLEVINAFFVYLRSQLTFSLSEAQASRSKETFLGTKKCMRRVAHLYVLYIQIKYIKYIMLTHVLPRVARGG